MEQQVPRFIGASPSLFILSVLLPELQLTLQAPSVAWLSHNSREATLYYRSTSPD